MIQIKVELQEYMGDDKSIANAAWTSSSTYQQKKKRTDEDVKRVVELLANSRHSVPFESIVYKFWLRLPIAIDRQLMTHRVASHSGMSGRYRTMPSDFFDIPDDCMDLLEKIKERKMTPLDNYYEICDKANTYYSLILADFKEAEKANEITNSEYKRLREIFRGMLPQHNMTERVTVINLRSLANFFKLRLKPDAQPEIRGLAEKMLAEVKRINNCPIAIDFLEKNGWVI
jgi:thymidylate synthase (FAD)